MVRPTQDQGARSRAVRAASLAAARTARGRAGILDHMTADAYKSVRAGALAQRCTADASYPYLLFKGCRYYLYSVW